MPENSEICKILIVDDDVDCAKKIAYELEQIPPFLLENHTLDIEISNTAYFVVKHIENCIEKKIPWDIILSDVYMPIPSHPLKKKVAIETAEPDEIEYENYTWKFWNYKYSWNSSLGGNFISPDHGGLYLSNKIKCLKEKFAALKELKVVLISDRLHDPNSREKIFEFLRFEHFWIDFYDKAKWEEETKDWPENSNHPDIFKHAVIHAINDRHSEIWGDSLFIDNGTAPPLSTSMRKVTTLAKTKAKNPKVDTILITGDRGTGKTSLARLIHWLRMQISGTNGKFEKFECTRHGGELFESELFGHVEGAFTGAIRDTDGVVKKAKGGTLLFDEIGDLSPPNQGKLLSLLEDRQFVKVGSSEIENLDTELIIFATNKNLDELQENGYFRRDLYDRMRPPPLHIPPLNNRREDIIPLAKHFLKKFNNNFTISEEAKQFL